MQPRLMLPKSDEAEPDTSKAAAPEANGARPEAAKADASKPDDQPEASKADGAKADPPKADGAKADAAKNNVQVPTDTGTIQEALTKFKVESRAWADPGRGGEPAQERRSERHQGKAHQSAHAIPEVPLGTDRLDDRNCGDTLRSSSSLGRLHHHLFMLALNAVVGFWEEFKADNEIEALKKHLALHSPRPARWQVE